MESPVLRGLEPASCYDVWLATFHIIDMLYNDEYECVSRLLDQVEGQESM